MPLVDNAHIVQPLILLLAYPCCVLDNPNGNLAVIPNLTSKLARKIKIMQRSMIQKMRFKPSPVCDGLMRVRLNKHKICKLINCFYEDIF